MSEKDLQNVEEGRSKFSSYVLTQAILVTVACSLILIFARDRPPTFPSKAASKKQEPLNFKKEFAALMANKNYMILCLAFTCQYANTSALGAIISSITFSYGYMSTDNAIFGGSILVAFLLYHRVVVHDVAESVDGNIVIGDRVESAGQDKSQDFFSFGGGP